MARKIQTSTYIKNVGKSFGYAVGDVFESYNPVITNIYRQSKRTTENIKRSMRESKIAEQQSSSASEGLGFEYIIEDLMSGKWYNKDRKNKEDAMKDYLIKSDEDWGDDDEVTESAKDIMRQNEAKTRELTSSMSQISSDISSSYAYASAKSANYIVKSNNASARAIYNLTSRGFNQVTNVLLNINNSIDGIASMGTSLQTHMQNSAIFYATTTDTLKKMNESLDKLVDASVKSTKSHSGEYKRNRKGIENFIDINGNFDMEAFGSMMYKSYKEQKQIYDLLMGSQKDIKRSQGGLIQNMVVDFVDSAIPAFAKESMKQFNQTINDTIISALSQSSIRFSNSKNPLASMLSLLLPKDGYKTKIDNSNYNKGQVSWDGIARKSLVEVIPTYLAKIYAALGGEEKYFDYESGKFVTLRDIDVSHRYKKARSAAYSGGEMRKDLLAEIDNNESMSDKSKEFSKREIERFFLTAFEDGLDFTEVAQHIKGKTKEDRAFLKKYGISRRTAKQIEEYIFSGDRNKTRNTSTFMKNVYLERNRFGNNMRRLEAEGRSSLNYTSNGFASEQDKYNKSQAYYLRGIYQMVGNIYGSMGGTGTYNPDKAGKPVGATMYFDPDKGKFVKRRSSSSKEKQAKNKEDDFVLTEDDIKYGSMDKKTIEVMKANEKFKENYQKVYDNIDRILLGLTPEEYKKQKEDEANFRGGRSKLRQLIDTPAEYITSFIDTLTDGITQLFWGNRNRPGLIDRTANYLDDIWKRMIGEISHSNEEGGLKAAMKKEWQEMKTRAKNKTKSFFGSVAGRRTALKNTLDYNSEVASIDAEIAKLDAEAAQGGGASGMGPREVGDVYNENGTWYLVGKKKDIEITQEQANEIINKQIKRARKSQNKTRLRKVLGKASDHYKLSTDIAKKQIEANTGLFTAIDDGVNKLGSGMKQFLEKCLYGDEAQQKKDKESVFKSVTDVFKEMNNEKGAMAIGGLAGAGVSLLTGAVVGPLAGAAIGAGLGLMYKSEKVQDAIFGKPDKDGNYEKPIGNFMMKYLPNMAKGGGIGAAAGTLLGSPVLGALVGSSIGYINSSETAKKFLFGTIAYDDNGNKIGRMGGFISKDLQDKIKEMAPNLGAGIIASMLVGPFGVPGNILLGSALGYVSTTDKFHEFIFGDGKDNKGLAGTIHDKIIGNLDNIFNNTTNAIKGLFKKVGKKVGNFGKNLFNGITQAVQDALKGHPMIKKIADGIVKYNPVNLAGSALTKISNMGKKHNLKKGYDVYDTELGRNLTAEERLSARDKLNLGPTGKIDTAKIFAITKNAEDTKALVNAIRDNDDSAVNSILFKYNNQKLTDLVIKLQKDQKDARKYKGNYGAWDKHLAGVDSLDDLKSLRKDIEDLDNRKQNYRVKQHAMINEQSTRIFQITRNDKDTNALTKAIKNGDKRTIDNILAKYQNDELNKIVGDLEAKSKANFDELIGSNAKLKALRDKGIISKGTNLTTLLGSIDNEEKLRFTGDKLIEKKAEDKDTNIVGILAHIDELISVAQDENPYTVRGEFKTILQRVFKKDKKNAGINHDINNAPSVPSDGDYTPGRTYEKDGKFYKIDKNGNPEEISKGVFYSSKKNDIMNRMEEAAKKKREETTTEVANMGSTFHDIEGGASKIKDTVNKVTTQIDMFGNVHQYARNNQGELVESANDTETKKSRELINKFTNSVNSVPGIVTSLGGLSGIMGKLKEGLLGSEDGKKEGLLSKLMGGLFGDKGLLSNMFSFLTGKSGIGAGLLNGITKENLIKGVGLPALLLAGFSGKLDGIGSIVGNMSMFKGNDNKSAFANNTSTAVETSSGELKQLQTNKDGSFVTDDNGNYIASDGSSVAKNEITKIKSGGSNTSVSSQLKKNLVNGAIMKHGSVTTKVLSTAKNNLGKMQIVNKGASFIKEKGGKLAKKVAESGLVDNILSGIKTGLEAIPALLGNIPFLKNSAFVTNSSKWIDKLMTFIKSATGKASKGSLDGLLSKVKKIAPFVQAAFIIGKGINAWGNAESILGITQDATTGQRMIAVVISVLNAAIPVIGDLIPTKTLVNIFMEVIAPMLNIDVSGLKEQRDAASKEVEAYNAENGTNYSIEEYNQIVKNKAGVFTKVGNSIKSGITSIKENGLFGNKNKSNNSGGASGIISRSKSNIPSPMNPSSQIISNMSNGLRNIGSKIDDVTGIKKLTEYAARGDLKGYLMYNGESDNTKDETGIKDIVTKLPLLTTKIAMLPKALMMITGSKIFKVFKNITTGIKTDGSSFASAFQQLSNASNNGEISEVTSLEWTPSKDNPVSGLFQAAFGISKAFNVVGSVFNNIVNPIKDFIGGIVDNVKDFATNTWNKFKGTDLSTGGTSTPSGGDSGFVSQYDPRYQSYNVSGERFAGKGCGPAVATMAARALGKNMSVSDAVSSSRGYQTGNGVSIDYFRSALGAKGINTRYIAGGSSSDLYSSIAAGDKVVLLGRDPYNTSKEVSPFGPNNHYVLATGLDSSGNIIVNDPESNRPRSYSPAILNSASYGIAGSNSGIYTRISPSRYARQLYSGGSSSVAAQVWNFLINNGFTEQAAAGVMGNLQQETGMKPETKTKVTQGIACWDKQNGVYPLEEAAKAAGKDWKDLGFQLSYLLAGLPSAFKTYTGREKHYYKNGEWCWWPTKMSFDEFKKLTSINDATEIFERVYERASKPMMENRKKYANDYYKQFTGKSGEPITSSSSSSSSYSSSSSSSSSSASNNSGTTSSAKSGNILTMMSDVSNIFGDSLSKVLGMNLSSIFDNAFSGTKEEEDTTTSSTSSSSVSGSDSITYTNMGGSGNSKQKDLVNKLLGIKGTLSYSMSGARNPEKGSADCSSTVNWAYKKVTGTDIGNSTDAIINSSATEVVDMAKNMDISKGGKNSSGPTESNLMPGDLLLYSRPDSNYSSGRKYRVGHVEMYIGDGQRIGHGGPGNGPNVTALTKDASRYIMAKRLKGIASGAGSGLNPMSYSDIAKISGGSSGLLLSSRPGSRNELYVRTPSGSLVPTNRFSGGASDITEATRSMLTNMKNTTRNNSNGISPELVAKLLESITVILNNIADNTAPVNKIYNALVAYLQSGGSSGNSDKVVVNKNNNSSKTQSINNSTDVDSNISTLVGVLAELAKG